MKFTIARAISTHTSSTRQPILWARCGSPGRTAERMSKIPANAQNLRPYPQYQSIGGKNYVGISNYDSLQLSVIKRFSHGLQQLQHRL